MRAEESRGLFVQSKHRTGPMMTQSPMDQNRRSSQRTAPRQHPRARRLTGVRERWGCGRPTERSLDALLHYRDGCGSLLYLGGNGFYWRVAVDDAGTVEIRRGEGGIRAWASEPGEYYNAIDGGWVRRRGRPNLPERLVRPLPLCPPLFVRADEGVGRDDVGRRPQLSASA